MESTTAGLYCLNFQLFPLLLGIVAILETACITRDSVPRSGGIMQIFELPGLSIWPLGRIERAKSSTDAL